MRRVDPEPYRRFLEERGIVVHPASLAFFASFGGLCIPYVSPYEGDDEIFLNVLDHGNLERSDFDTKEEILNRPLTYLGFFSEGFCTLLMDEEGRVYVQIEAWVAFGGHSGAEALNAILSKTELPRVF